MAWLLLLTVIALLAPLPLAAAGRGADPCVAVDIAGQRVANTACAARRLQDAARIAQRRAREGTGAIVPGAGAGDTVVGVGSLAGSSQRLGADLRGRTTLPTSPAPRLPVSPFVGRR